MRTLRIRTHFGSPGQKERTLQGLDRFSHMPVRTQLQFSTTMYTGIQFADKDLSFRFWVPSRYTVTWSFFHSAVSYPGFSHYSTAIAEHHLDSQGQFLEAKMATNEVEQRTISTYLQDDYLLIWVEAFLIDRKAQKFRQK
jgi:hypothetical protein